MDEIDIIRSISHRSFRQHPFADPRRKRTKVGRGSLLPARHLAIMTGGWWSEAGQTRRGWHEARNADFDFFAIFCASRTLG
jgi:hypothetical protein